MDAPLRGQPHQLSSIPSMQLGARAPWPVRAPSAASTPQHAPLRPMPLHPMPPHTTHTHAARRTPAGLRAAGDGHAGPRTPSDARDDEEGRGRGKGGGQQGGPCAWKAGLLCSAPACAAAQARGSPCCAAPCICWVGVCGRSKWAAPCPFTHHKLHMRLATQVLVDVNWRPVFWEDHGEAKREITAYLQQVGGGACTPRTAGTHHPVGVLASCAGNRSAYCWVHWNLVASSGPA